MKFQKDMEIGEIREGILYLLEGDAPTGDGNGYTFLEVREFLKLNNVQDYFEGEKEDWKGLKSILDCMEKEGLIEERHFGDALGGRVDFSLNQSGIDLIEKKRKKMKERGVKLEEKWELPDFV